MRYVKNSVVTLLFFFILSSCKKSDGSSGSTTTTPSNLVVTANLSTNGSGNVTFTATADNASTYVYDYGNGIFATVPSGIITYKYTTVGTISYAVVVTAKSSSGTSISKSIQVTVTVVAGTPTLFWSEEFNVDGAPDPLNWGYDIGTGSGGWGNNELEYYTSRPQNVLVQGGVLKINAIRENYSGSAFTSARLISKNKFSFQYGKVDIRAKLPAGIGTWPAAWMLGNNIGSVGWPNCGEMDIMEHRGSELNKIFGTLHYPGHSGGNADGSTTVIANATTAFHVYSLDWSAVDIKIYVDGVLFHTVANSNTLPFNQDFFFILNVAMGGNFGGAVDPAFTSSTMEVDYIRVYK